MFYGDQTLQGLLKHSRTLLNEMYDFQEKYQTSEEIDFDETEEDPPSQEKEPLFYRSTSASYC